MARAREYRASLVVSAAAASAATTTAITAVLLVQLRKLRPIKWWSVKLWRIHAHAPGSHRVVTLSHSHTQPSNLTFSDRTAGRCGRRGNYFLHHNFSLSLSLTRGTSTQAADSTRRVLNTRELAPVAQAGGRVSTVQWLRRNQNGKERHGNW